MAEHANEDRRTPLAPRGSRVQETAARIREALLHSFKPGDILPTERQFVETLGVGRRTVRAALAALRAEGWLEQHPRRGHRVAQPHWEVQPITGLYFPFDAEGLVARCFNRDVFVGLTTAAAKHGRHLLSFCGLCRYYRELQPSRFWSPGMQAVDSMITFEVYKMDLLEQVAKQYPLVCLDAPCDAPNVSSVVFDNVAAVRMAFKYLVDLGHRRIGFAGRELGHIDPATIERREGYRRSLEWSGLSSEPWWIVTNIPDNQAEPERLFAQQWKQAPPDRRPTAVVSTYSFWPLVATLTLAGVKVPGDISVVGVSGSGTWSDALREAQPFTSGGRLPAWMHGVASPRTSGPPELAWMEAARAELPATAMGRWGMEEVVRRAGNPDSEPRHEVLIPTLVPGDTAAAPGVRHSLRSGKERHANPG